tara:strand:- start:175 stop:450 length:276 start_codon:yes stop_codon:yes gene_type:complete
MEIQMKEHYKNNLKNWYKNEEVILELPEKTLNNIEELLLLNKYDRDNNNYGIKFIKFNKEQIVINDLKKCIEFLNKNIDKIIEDDILWSHK